MTGLNLSPSQWVRIEKLAAIYRTRFELRCPPEPTLLKYGYPDLLDRARRAMNWDISHHHQACDVGSSTFAYAAALQAFFHPLHLVGTEVYGHRLYCNERSRIGYAQGHIQALPQNYVVTDYRPYNHPRKNPLCQGSLRHSRTAHGLTLAQIKLFGPAAPFAQIGNNFVLSGTFVMINYSLTEANVTQNPIEGTAIICQERFHFSLHFIIKYLLLYFKLGMEGNVLRQVDFLISYSQPGNGLARQSKAAA